ncbi:MAG: peptidoglycan DD-metalloendopeptidase family protein [Mizugakiibacter sp.]|uniref:OapA family protein n=1 Tax=Mizugakiibacter sp. TaxID=1972610 RepID=UPI0031BDD99B|nr:peptidoglycan DD-metalloendopeptidase family protein [Xanthomonadaceae bacterium]
MGEGLSHAAHSARRRAIRRKAQQRHVHFYSRCAHWSVCRTGIAPISWHRERWVLGGTALLLVLLTLVVIPAWASAMRHDAPAPEHTLLALKLPPLPAAARQAAAVPEDWRTVRVQPGQTLADIFHGLGLGPGDLQRVLDAGQDGQALRRIHPGDEFAFLQDGSGALKGLRFDRDEATRVTLRLDANRISESVQARAVERREHLAHGSIDSSLFDAGSQAGMSDAMILQLAKVFGYDIDFAQDLRPGDSFTVIYNDVYRDGEYLHEGDIVAAEFVNQGRRYTAYRFQTAGGDVGYYSEDGRPLRKSFLRTPVDFTRISSRFTAARMHPILGRMRAHKGVDYAAPTGTPIYAAGDGVIRYRGWENGYGNFVVIQHNSTISTAYGHMSRFAGGERIGGRVHQGQIIGYVGMTGLATGPHLHYEFRVNGAQRDPLTVTLPKPEPLPVAQLAQFRRQNAPLLARMKAIDGGVRLARAGNGAGAVGGSD